MTAGIWDLNVGQVYSTLDRMLKDGLVALEEADGGGDDRKVYRITSAGIAELEDWLEHPPLKPRPLRDEVYVRLALLIDRDIRAALDLIETQRRVYHVQLADLTRKKMKLPRGRQPDGLNLELLIDAAILHVEADLKWLETCEEKVRARRMAT